MCFCLWCQVLCEKLSNCFRNDANAPQNRGKGGTGKEVKKRLSATVRSPKYKSAKTPPKRKRRKTESWGKRLSQLSDEEILKPIHLPIDGIREPIEYMKKHNFEILIDQLIARGTYGEVFKAQQLAVNGSNKLIACKVIKVRELRKRQKMIESMRRELYFLEKLDFHYIIKTIKHFVFEYLTQNSVKEMNAFIFMEYATEGNLEDELDISGPFANDVAKRYFGQIACGVKCMHNHSIAHRDLKLENILLVKSVDSPGLKDCKISDFGLSQIVYKEGVGFVKLDQYLGTRPYLAPEVLRLRMFLSKGAPKSQDLLYEPMPVDCWALGVIAYRLLTKDFPFYLTECEAYVIQKALKDQKSKNWTFPENVFIDPLAKDLISKSLEPDISKRINMPGIISHLWLEGETSLSTIMTPTLH